MHYFVKNSRCVGLEYIVGAGEQCSGILHIVFISDIPLEYQLTLHGLALVAGELLQSYCELVWHC